MLVSLAKHSNYLKYIVAIIWCTQRQSIVYRTNLFSNIFTCLTVNDDNEHNSILKPVKLCVFMCCPYIYYIHAIRSKIELVFMFLIVCQTHDVMLFIIKFFNMRPSLVNNFHIITILNKRVFFSVSIILF